VSKKLAWQTSKKVKSQSRNGKRGVDSRTWNATAHAHHGGKNQCGIVLKISTDPAIATVANEA
jgi:hypothetical protein